MVSGVAEGDVVVPFPGFDVGECAVPAVGVNLPDAFDTSHNGPPLFMH